MIMEYLPPITGSFSCMCCSEMQQRRQQQNSCNENIVPTEWEYAMISQPLPLHRFKVGVQKAGNYDNMYICVTVYVYFLGGKSITSTVGISSARLNASSSNL